jgi:hypothetical protein
MATEQFWRDRRIWPIASLPAKKADPLPFFPIDQQVDFCFSQDSKDIIEVQN